MYYWDLFNELFDHVLGVSVVVRRMYYWDRGFTAFLSVNDRFQ